MANGIVVSAKQNKTEKPQPDTNANDTTDQPTDTTFTTLDSIADNLVDAMPDVQEHAIEQESVKQNEEVAKWAHLTDVDGRAFDPAIHKTNKNGEPTTTTKGNLIKKPSAGKQGGRPRSASYVGGVQSQQAAQPDTSEQVRIQARATGKMAANLLLTLGVVAGGEEWQPMKNTDYGIDEKLTLESAFADYFESTGQTDLPPAMALTVAVGGYALPRFTMPKTRTRIQKIGDWFTRKAADRKLRKYGLKAEKMENA